MATTLITDRTAADVEYAKAVVAAVQAGGAIPTDYFNLKGCYTYNDLNRVETFCNYLVAELAKLGYNVNIQTKQWTDTGEFNYDEVLRYLGNISSLRGAFVQLSTTPQTPNSFAPFTNANAIEKILLDIEDSIRRIPAGWRYSGTFYAGQYTGMGVI